MPTQVIYKSSNLRNTFSNPRENHDIIGDRTDITLSEELIKSADASYIFRSPIVNARLTAYYNKVENASEVSFYYADGVGGDNNAFVQEILQGVEKLNIGTEIGLEAQVTPTIKLKGAAAIGQFTYDNNPNLYVTTEPGRGGNIEGADSYLGELFTQGYYNFGKAYLKDYKLAAGPHKAYSLGFEYRTLIIGGLVLLQTSSAKPMLMLVILLEHLTLLLIMMVSFSMIMIQKLLENYSNKKNLTTIW